MLMKYLSEYHPWRIRSTSSLNTAGGRRRRSNTLIQIDYRGVLALALHPPGMFYSSGKPMESGALKVLDVSLYRRGPLIASPARWASFGLGPLLVVFLLDGPRTPPPPPPPPGAALFCFT